MESIKVKDVDGLGDLLYSLVLEEEKDVTAVLFYNDAQKLFRHLIQYEDVSIDYINFNKWDDNYNKEYYVTLRYDLGLVIEPAMKFSGYRYIPTDAMFLDGDSSYKIAQVNEGCCQFEVGFENKKKLSNSKKNDSSYYNDLMDLFEFIFSVLDD